MGRARKNKFFEQITIVDIAAKGKAVAKSQEGETIFLNSGVPGDIVDVKTYKKRKGYYEGNVVRLHQASKDRISAVCEHFGICGGCKWQHMNYKAQLHFKAKEVHENLKRIGGVIPEETLDILGIKDPYWYRNKMEFSFSNQRWMTQEEIDSGETFEKNGLGFHKPGMWDKIVDIKKCHLQADPSNAIRNEIRRYALEHQMDFFNPKTQEGLLRSLLIRTSALGQVMVLIQFVYKDDAAMALLDHLRERFPAIHSLLYVINDQANDVLYPHTIHVHSGKDYIEEGMEDLIFRIGPKTFYQTNSSQAYHLYTIARDFADLKGDECVYDLYTGIGTIAQFIAQKAKKVVGVDVVPESIEAAKQNAKANNIDNTLFEAGDMKNIFTPSFIERHGKADVVITDPPREGMHKDVVKQLLAMAPEKIVYVSCNSATQARDLALMKEHYSVVRSQAVDMFPQTHHVENVVLLSKIKQNA